MSLWASARHDPEVTTAELTRAEDLCEQVIASVTSTLAAEVRARLDPVIVDAVVHGAIADLAHDVPLASLAEFAHRSARQRLLETAAG
jgi:hypothetical protein